MQEGTIEEKGPRENRKAAERFAVKSNRTLLWLAILGVAAVAVYYYSADPPPAPPPVSKPIASTPPVPRPAAPAAESEVTEEPTAGDITAEEAAEAFKRLEEEQKEK